VDEEGSPMVAALSRDDRDEINDVLVRYAIGIDRRDWALFRTCFTSDCEADYGAIGVWHGVEEITEWMEARHAPCGFTLHRLTNVVVASSDVGATARSYVDALVLGPDNRSGTQGVGIYDDDLVRTAEGWRIARRTFTMVLRRRVGPDPTS
jgi:3-phenylpropionate/cinnamic acid dioxygenase small subunit